jgi:phytoene synthase
MIFESPQRPGTPLPGPYGAAESIASRDQNNLYLTSRFLRDVERYKAFCAYYALMRVVDDRVDDLPHGAGLSMTRKRSEHEVLTAWEEAILEIFDGGFPTPSVVRRCDHLDAHELLQAFARSLTHCRVPRSLWTSFFRSMRWDLDHDRFETWQDFLIYAEGASVAPTTIYLALLASDLPPAVESLSVPPGFDLRQCGRELGTFAYLGHIVRDIAEDLRKPGRGLLYVTREDMRTHGLTEPLLRGDVERGRASVATRSLVADLVGRAHRYLEAGRRSMIPLHGVLPPDRSFILELIVTIYERVIAKIVACCFDPLAGRHKLTPAEKWAIVLEVAKQEGFDPPTAVPTLEE